MDALNIAGERILSVMQQASFWVAIIGGTGMSIKCLAKGDTHGAIKIVLSYILGFACIYILPWGLKIIQEAFR